MKHQQFLKLGLTVSALLMSHSLMAGVDSGSTGADGAFNPTVSQQMTLPEYVQMEQ